MFIPLGGNPPNIHRSGASCFTARILRGPSVQRGQALPSWPLASGLMRPCLLIAGVAAFACAAALASGHPPKGATRCQVFPRDNQWNQRVDSLPVAVGSDRLVRSIGLSAPVHPDFGSGRYEGRPIGIPFTT